MNLANQTYNIYYDTEGDFLEILFGEPSDCYANEIDKGIFVRKDKKTDEIKSIGILGFKKRTIMLKAILKKMNLDFPLEISV